MVNSTPPLPPLPADDNPFAAPSLAASAPGDIEDRDFESLVGVRKTLMKTRPWVLGISIFGFIAGGWTLLSMLASAFFLRLSQTGGFPAIFLGMSLLVGAVTIALSMLLWSYAMRIKRFRDRPTAETLRRALEAQTAFWRVTGVSLVGSIALYFVVIFLAVTELTNIQRETNGGSKTEVEVEPTPPR